VSEGVGVISMKNKQVMTYWNKTLLEVEFNQKHIEREKDAIKEKEKDKKESESNGVNGVDKDKEAMQDVQNNKRKGSQDKSVDSKSKKGKDEIKKGDLKSKDLNAKQLKNLKRLNSADKDKNKKVKARKKQTS
jgi:hypothetical protein